LKPLFTVHAGEFLVACEIERNFRGLNVWIPTKDTGVDLLVSNRDNTQTVSLQVKFSRDYLVTNIKDELLLTQLRACGWWTPTRRQIESSRAQYWVFVLVGFAQRSTDFIIIKPADLLKRLDRIHARAGEKFQTYLWVTQHGNCFETRGLNRDAHVLIGERSFEHMDRDFTPYLNDWSCIKSLEDERGKQAGARGSPETQAKVTPLHA
jgi:hypothetical protein